MKLGGGVTLEAAAGRLRGGRPSCCIPSPGGATRLTSGKVTFRFGKLGKAGRPPVSGTKPGCGTAPFTLRGTVCLGITWLGAGMMETPVGGLIWTLVGSELTDKTLLRG